jgi:hypothetical protein
MVSYSGREVYGNRGERDREKREGEAIETTAKSVVSIASPSL